MYKCILGFGKINPGTCLAIKTFSEPKSEAEHHRMHDELLGYRQWIDSELKQNVVLVAPPLPQNHYFHHVHKISGFSDWHSTAIFNGLAVPVACAPIGLDSNGYPMSVQLVSARGNEFLLMRMQEFLEEKFGGWQPPRKFD
uniref:Amidase domain-containing protein n=2 Tax=Bursaphelenchus xylophilus TaxID=6326 RepID=A0A1I7SL01_BURXY